MKTLVVIPARYGSSRFPGKALALLGGKPILQWTCEHAAEVADRVVMATDDTRIAEAASAAGFETVMSLTRHTNGTSRVHEAFGRLGYDADLIINLQVDEPMLVPGHLLRLIEAMGDDNVGIATLCAPFGTDATYARIADPNTVKVVTDIKGDALMFTRSVIPYLRGVDCADWPTMFPYQRHIGVYAYRPAVLRQLVYLPQSRLEACESLEQLRWLENGYKIRVVSVDDDSIGIDTPQDLALLNEKLCKQNA